MTTCRNSNILLNALLCSALSLLTLPVRAQQMPFSLSAASRHPKVETRAVWITVLNQLDWPDTHALTPQSVEKQKQEIVDQLEAFHKANFNTVLMQTRMRGDLIYPSAIEPFSDALTGTSVKDPGYDPLAFIIDECHKRGMECHAWVVAIPVGGDKHVRSQGKLSVVSRHRSICMHYKGCWYLNPGVPEAKEYLFSVVKEMVTRYDLDGVNFDYIRYPDGRSRLPDRAQFRKYGKGRTLAQWRRDNLTEMVRYIYKGIKEIKPYIKVGSSPLGKYRDTQRYPSMGWNAYHAVYQDAQHWLAEGIQDVVMPMLYFRENHYYPFVYDWLENANGRTIVPGLGVYFLEEANWPLRDVEQQIYFTRSASVPGQAYFRAKFVLRNVSGLFDVIKRDIYPYPALTAPMRWQDSIPPMAPTGLTRREEDGKLILRWNGSTDNSRRSALDSGIRYNLYASTDEVVDTDLPQNIVALNLRDTLYVMDAAEARSLRFSVRAVDCYGNESVDPMKTSGDDADTARCHWMVTLDKTPGADRLTIEDAYGRVVLKEPFREELSTHGLDRGVYVVRVFDAKGEQLATKRFVKTE